MERKGLGLGQLVLNEGFTTVQAGDPVTFFAVDLPSGSAKLAWTATAGAISDSILGFVDGCGTSALVGKSTSPAFVDLGARTAGRTCAAWSPSARWPRATRGRVIGNKEALLP